MDKKTKMKINVLAIICIMVWAFALTPKTLQNDTFYTIKTGEHIMEYGIDGQDAFAWTDLKYTYPHWAYDTVMYLIYDHFGGMTGIYISTVILSMILGISIYVTNTKINKNNLFSFILTIGVMYLLKDFIAARAQLVSFILFVLEILCIECFLDTKKKRYAIFLMIIAALIANFHAAVFYVFFIFFLPYIAEYIVVCLRDSNFIYKFRIKSIKKKIEKYVKKEKPTEKVENLQNKLLVIEEKFEKYKTNARRREENPYKIKLVKRDAVKWLILVAVLCFAMGLLTPIGDEPYTHIIKLMSGDTTNSIAEHQPLVLKGHKGAITVLVLLLALLIFTDTKITLKDLFMISGLLILTFMARRQFSLLVSIGIFSFTKLLCDFVDKYDKNGTKEFTDLIISWQGKVITIVLIALISFCMYKDKMDDEYISTSSYPVSAADFILSEAEKENINLETMKLYNDYNYGSYLLFREIPVFIDSRADLYSPEFNDGCNIFDDYMTISSIGKYYEDGFNDYGITHVILYKNSKLNMFLSRDDNYKELYSDDNFIFYERLSANAESAE